MIMKNHDMREKALLILWLSLNLGLGIFIMQDFGISIDEENYYLYAESTIAAYSSFFGRLFEPIYGPGNLPNYGPAFLSLAYFPAQLLSTIMPKVLVSDIWHYSYFITFQFAGLSLYLLTKRWFKQVTAWSVLILFTTQPLLWGHAFINPKDIPFMFFFTFAILTGFWMVDSYDEKPITLSLKSHLTWFLRQWHQVIPKKRKFFSFWIKINGGMWIILWLFSFWAIEKIVEFFYNAPKGAWAHDIFIRLATQSNAISVENYIHKAQQLLLRAEYSFLFLNFIIVLFFLSRLLSQNFTELNFKKRFDEMNFIEKIRLFLKEIMKKKNLLNFVQHLWRNLRVWHVIFAGIILGITNSVRVLGPLAGGIVILYLLFKERQSKFSIVVAYLAWASLSSYLTWPYLWRSPLKHYFESLTMMSRFPWDGDILFKGVFYKAIDIPLSYLPTLMGIQFTEPAVLLILVGFIIFIKNLLQKDSPTDFLLFFLFGFLFVFSALILLQSPLYDNFRQVFFIIPALFLLAALALEKLWGRVTKYWARSIIIILLAFPGIYQSIQLHPYEYTYYNSFVGGMGGAFRRFETDYWRTSYRELADTLNPLAENNARVGVVGHQSLTPYSRPDLNIVRINSEEFKEFGGYAVLTSHWNYDQAYGEATILKTVERQGAIFSILKYVEKESPD